MEETSEQKHQKKAEHLRWNLKIKAVKVSIQRMPIALLNEIKKVNSEEKTERPKKEMKAERLKIKRRNHQKQNDLATLEAKKALYLQKIREQSRLNHIKKQETKALVEKQIELLGQNQKSDMPPKEVLRLAARFEAYRLRKNAESKRYRQKRKAVSTPEEKEAYRLKTLMHKRRSREKQRAKLAASRGEVNKRHRCLSTINEEYRQQLKNAKTPEERKALIMENRRQYHRKKQEKKVLIRKQAEELLRQTQKKEISSKEKEILRLASLIEAARIRKNKRAKQTSEKRKAEGTPEEIEAYRLRRCMTQRLCRQRRRKEREALGLQVSRKRCSRSENHTKPDSPLVVDEIKTEKEVLQETTIKTFRISSLKKAFPKRSSNFTKIDRRKIRVREHFNFMKKLINVTAKPDRLAVFGKHIAQKLRSIKKDVAEVNIAKLRIDDVLQNFIAGAYSSGIRNMVTQVICDE